MRPGQGKTRTPTAVSLPKELGNYRIVRPIGQGGMGAVYEAVHRNLKSRVALKTLSPRRWSDSGSVDRFYREMAAIGRVVDPHVVRALDAGEIEGVHYLVMEYVDGADAGRIARRGGPLAIPEAAEIVRQAALGLECIAGHNMVHRDIKPSNLLVSREGVVKIADLGLARLAACDDDSDALTSDGYVLGTLDYMAPEQATDARTVDIRGDIYSLGCTLYRLLSGRAVYDGAEFQSLPRKIAAHASLPPPRVTLACGDETPVDLQAILDCALEKNARDRFERPADLAEALAPFADNHELPAAVERSAATASADPQENTTAAGSSAALSSALVTTITTHPDARRSTKRTGQRGETSRRRAIAISAIGIALILGLFAVVAALSLPGEGDPEAPTPSTEPPAEPTGEPTELSAVLDLDAGPAKQWVRLLERQPAVVWWPKDDGRSTREFNKDLQQLTVNASGTSLLALGKTTATDFVIQMRVHQNGWPGGCGVFWGYRETDFDGDKLDPGGPRHQAHFIGFKRIDTLEDRTEYLLVRGVVPGYVAKNGEIKWGQHDITSVALSKPVGEQTLEIQFRWGKVASVRLNNQEFAKLTDMKLKLERRFAPQHHHGLFGVYNRSSSSSYRDGQAMWSDRENPAPGIRPIDKRAAMPASAGLLPAGRQVFHYFLLAQKGANQ